MLRRAVAASLLVLVAGCSSDPAPKEPASPTKSATPTIAAPTMPAQARENSPEGASAFVGHYIDVSNYAASTGDVEELSHLSDARCAGCQEYVKLFRDTYSAGGYFKGGNWELDDLKLDFGPGETFVDAHLTAPTGRYKASSGTPEESAKAEDTEISFAVVRRGESWVTSQMGLGVAK